MRNSNDSAKALQEIAKAAQQLGRATEKLAAGLSVRITNAAAPKAHPLGGRNFNLGAAPGQPNENSEGFAKKLREIGAVSDTLASTLSDKLVAAMTSVATGGESLSGALRGLGRSMLETFLGSAREAALKPFREGVASAFSSFNIAGLFGFAKGGVFAHGGPITTGFGANVRAFAQGGVVSGPTHFPMRRGVGLMGEAGPEAIMPLTRGPDGRLGVSAQSGAVGAVTINISTPNAESFQRSRAQTAAQIQRALSRGRRSM